MVQPYEVSNSSMLIMVNRKSWNLVECHISFFCLLYSHSFNPELVTSCSIPNLWFPPTNEKGNATWGTVDSSSLQKGKKKVDNSSKGIVTPQDDRILKWNMETIDITHD